MVSFSCHNCGDVVKKPKVLSHAQQCRAQSFSCVDCNKTFDLSSVKAHTECVSEVDRYQGKWLDKVKSLPKQKRPERPKMSFSDTDMDDDEPAKKKAQPEKKATTPKPSPKATPVAKPKKPLAASVDVPAFELGSAEEVAGLVAELVAQEKANGTTPAKQRKAVLKRLVAEVYSARIAKHVGSALDTAIAGKGPVGGVTLSAAGEFALAE